MAHPEQKDFFERLSISFGRHFGEACKILEIGSQNINGTVRTFFPQASEYIGIDLGLADCVDWVVPGELLELPDGWADITISTECFEHCEAWEKVLKNMLRMTKPGGLVIFTCASTGRAAHGTIDSEEVSSPFTTSYYKNLDVDNIAEKTKLGAYFQRHGFEVNSRSSDLYFWGVRSESALAELENYWESPLDRLSRSQGQLAQAAARHASVQAQLDESRLQFAEAKTEAEQAEAQALQAKAEAEQAKAEAEKAKAEAEKAKAEAEKAKAEALQARDSLNEIFNSTSWKATGPFRKAANFCKKSLYLRKVGRKARQLSKQWIYPVSPAVHSFLFFELRRKLVTLTSVSSKGNFFDFSQLFLKETADPFLPLVTIIVPCFDHGKYLRQRLDSIYQQTYSNYEVILLDDHSTDESIHILNEFASNHKQNTSLEINSINSGSPFRQWSKGLRLAKGELIWIAESDDFCDPNFLSELVPAFTNEAVMLAFSQIRFINEEGNADVWSMEQYLTEFEPRTWQSSFTVSAHKLVQKAWNRQNIIPNVSATLFRHHHHLDILSNSEWLHMRVCGDWLFYLTIARGGLVYYTPKTTNYYRQHLSNSSVGMHQQIQYLVEHISIAQSLVSLYSLDASNVKKMQAELAQRWTQHHGDVMPAEQRRNIDSLSNMGSSRKLNILIVAYSLIPGGGEILPLKLANILHSNGYAVTVLNCHQHPNEIGIRAMLKPGIPLVELKSLEAIPKLVEELGIEVIHSHHPWVDTTLSELLADNPTLAHVITSHGMYDEIDRDQFDRISKLLIPWIKKVSYVADKNKQPLLDLGFTEPQLRKISNAIDPMEIEPIERSSLGILEPNAFVVCLVSRAKREKGWQEAIEAIAIAQKQTDRPIHLLLAGEGVEEQRLKRITTDFRIHFLGFHSQPINLYACSDLGILPTFYPGESQPLSLIECLAAGKPFIASDIGEISSMLTMPEGIAGAVIPLWKGRVDPSAFADQILIHLDNQDIHHHRCHIAKLASTKFNPDVMATEYADLYADAIKICEDPIYGNKSRHYID